MLDFLTNAPREIRFGDLVLKVGALKFREQGYLQRWIREHAVKPSVRLKEQLEILPEEDHRKARYEALIAERNWPPQVNTPQGNEVLFGDTEGQAYFLAVMLRKYQPELTDGTLDLIAGGLSEVDFGVLVQIAFGEDGLDPKEVRAEVVTRLEAYYQAARDQIEQATAPSTGSGSSTPGEGTESTGERSSTTSGPSLPT